LNYSIDDFLHFFSSFWYPYYLDIRNVLLVFYISFISLLFYIILYFYNTFWYIFSTLYPKPSVNFSFYLYLFLSTFICSLVVPYILFAKIIFWSYLMNALSADNFGIFFFLHHVCIPPLPPHKCGCLFLACFPQILLTPDWVLTLSAQ
jgi:hypothetical protein